MRNHEDLEVWSKAHALTLRLYQLTNGFPKSEMFGLSSQIRRAAASIEANLAEGCGRWSDPELARFVRIAMGSASELQCHLLLARDLGFIGLKEHSGTRSQLTSVRQMLVAFLRTIDRDRKQSSKVSDS
jgi:four helix bundle protein